jgi:hydroxymethylpyrimidine pyrophosphatase-like HAD family hydrolase
LVRFLALATDYDGTLARDGIVSAETVAALERFLASGHRLILVTGRELPELKTVFPRLDLFERVVAENGALLYNPALQRKRVLAERPPDRFVEALRRRIPNVRMGDVIVALWRPHEHEALEIIAEFGLELQLIFNKDAVMILPASVNKMTGMSAALHDMKISRHKVVGVGDAENDHAFLHCCEYAVAVANAIPSLKEEADLITAASHGEGVVELIERMIRNDLPVGSAGLPEESEKTNIGG